MTGAGAAGRTGEDKRGLDPPLPVMFPALRFRRTPLDNPWMAIAGGIALTGLLVLFLRVWMRA